MVSGTVIKRLYEVLIAFDTATASSDAEALMEKLKALVAGAQGEVREIEKQGVRKLAFRVRGKTDAQFCAFRYEAPTDVVKQVEEVLRLNEAVMRYMTMRIQPSQIGAPASAAARTGASQPESPAPAAGQPASTPPPPSAPGS